MARVAVSFLLLATIGGCTDSAFRSYANAVGPELHSQKTVRNTALLAAYKVNLCTQAGIVDSHGACDFGNSKNYMTFVDMGIYDIDERCDAFLDSLYYKDKTEEPILEQISDVASATRVILQITKSSSIALSVVATAFDLATDSFRNTRRTLLEALDPTTVKSIVFKRQREIKQEIYASSITSLPSALHALRAYLRVCMPFTIEMEANAILTTVQRTGEAGESSIVFDRTKFRKELESDQNTGSEEGTGASPGTAAANDMSAIERDTAPETHRRFARSLCVAGVPESALDFGPAGSAIRVAIGQWEKGLREAVQGDIKENGQIDTATEAKLMRQVISTKNRYRCDAGTQLATSAFEVAVLLLPEKRAEIQKRILIYLNTVKDSPSLNCGAGPAAIAFDAALKHSEQEGTFASESRKALAVAKGCVIDSKMVTLKRDSEIEPAVFEAI